MRILLAPLIAMSFAPSSRADDSFAKFADDYFAARYAFNPSEGTAQGFHEYDAKIEDLSRAAIEARVNGLKGLLERLGAVRSGTLSFDEEIDAQVLDGAIRSELLELETLKTWRSNPMAYVGVPGNAIDGLMKRDFAPKAERLRSIIARLKGVPALHEALKANVENPPKEFTDLAVRMAKGSVGFFRDSVASFAKDAAGGDEAWTQLSQGLLLLS